jgi:hypothetical protein
LQLDPFDDDCFLLRQPCAAAQRERFAPGAAASLAEPKDL